MTTKFKLALLAAGAVLAMASGAANAAYGTPDIITIQESAITGTPSNQFNADKLSGQYTENFSVNALGQFQSSAIFNAGGWFLGNNASPQISYLNGPGVSGYQLYAKFVATGTVTGSANNAVFTALTGTVQLFADVNADSTVNLVGLGSTANLTNDFSGTNLGDDVMLGTATVLIAGQGNNNTNPLNNGSFELVFGDFTFASAMGANYFIAPRPFDMILDLNGNFANLNTTPGSNSTTSSSANAYFVRSVPEPSALALGGIALVGAAFATRRKNRKA